MAKRLMVLFFMVITGSSLFAQKTLQIKGSGSNLFLEHTVAPKETLYSVGRLYNVSPKELAAYNQLQIETGLTINQNIKIPLLNNNFSQTEKKSAGEVLLPVYHTVGPKETLYRLGVNFNKVPLASLKKWNHLQSDAVSEGSQMIVGYLKVDKGQSALANENTALITDVVVTPKVEERSMDTPAPAVREPEQVSAQNKPSNVVQTGEPKSVVTTVNTKSTVNFSGGIFKGLYEEQSQSKSPVNTNASVGVFKSTSGWQDGKYYCFSNAAAPGTVLKVTSNASGKSVYAKVLDAIPDIKQNSGLSLVLSNAAAEELGNAESKFDCMVSFSK